VSTVFPKVIAVARAIVDPQFQHTATHTVHMKHGALIQAGEGNGHLHGGTGVKILKPLVEGITAVRSHALPHFNQYVW
jgi:hypothetical protein